MTQQLTGVQRYANEIIAEFDKLIPKGVVELAVPSNAVDLPNYENIKIVRTGAFKGNMWEQISFPLYLIKNKAVGVNLCNVAPLIKPDIVCIHDVNFLANPHFYDKNFVRWYKLQFKNSCKNAKMILTVSNFSKNEIKKYSAKINCKIKVIPNAWQHFNRIIEDDSIFEKNKQLIKNNYYFSLMSVNKNKNLKWILNVAKINPNIIFAVAGGGNLKVFGEEIDLGTLSNVVYLGRVSDEEAKSLMKNCKAFLFPTYYEGFGIPPLEAMSTGAKAIVSNSSCMPEIYQNSVYYVNPDDYDVNLDKLLEKEVDNTQEVLNKYSWEKSARKLKELIF